MSVPLASLLFIFLMGCTCLSARAQGRFRIMEYNCENLFDTIHDKGKEDYAFLPTSVRRWNGRLFRRKLNRISKVIMAGGEGLLPDLVALCEVENDSVMQALTRKSLLARAGYNYVMTASRDRRGIDVALLYQPGTFRLITARSYQPDPLRTGGRPTRDILHVTGMVRTLDTLDVFVCHLPSRVSGRKVTESARLYVARLLKSKADSVAERRTAPMIVLTGDFNDEPDNRSLQLFRERYNLLTDGIKGIFHPDRVHGSYYYKGIWNRLDHFLVNKDWGNGRTTFRPNPSLRARLLDFPFLLETDKTYSRPRPSGYYHGIRYNGGYSDHLPVVIDFVYE